MADLKLQAIITVADKASGPLREINRNIGRATAPLTRLSRQLKTFDRISGLKNFRGAMDGIARSAGVLSLKLGGLATGGFFLLKNTIIDTGAQFETYQAILTSIEGSSEKARTSMDWVSDFAANTPLQLDGVMDAFVKLRTFGLDPMNGTLQALVDQNAKLGGSQANLEGIVLAVGQAWTKGKLQGEEALQLIERGVPVWDLMAKATGKTALELQKLSSKGELGRESIALLIEEIGKSSIGASGEQMKTFAGLMSNLSDQWVRFQKMIADAGIFDVIKGKAGELLERINELAKSGELQKFAKEISDGLIKIVKHIPPLVAGIVEFGRAASDFVGGPGNLLKISVIALSAIMVGPLLASLISIVSALGTMAVAIAALSAPVLGFIAFVAAVIGAFVLLNDWFKNGAPEWLTTWSGLWEGIKTVFSAGVTIIGTLINTALNPLVGIVKAVWGGLADFFSGLWDGIIGIIDAATASIRAKIGSIIGFARSIGSTISGLFGGAGGAGETALPQQRRSIIGARNKSDVGGTIKIQIDSAGQPRVEKIKPNNPDVGFNVDAGLNLAAAG